MCFLLFYAYFESTYLHEAVNFQMKIIKSKYRITLVTQLYSEFLLSLQIAYIAVKH